MTTFMRTPGGMRSYAKFFSADVTVYIEGRIDGKGCINAATYDELYYRAILNEINNDIKYVIKVVGCKESVVDIAKKYKNQ